MITKNTTPFHLGQLIQPGKTGAAQAANTLATSPTAPVTLDFTRRYSLGPGRGKTLIQENVNAQSVSFTITNTYTTPKVVALGSVNNTMYVNAAALLAAISADALITDGVIAGSADTTITVTSNDPGRPVGNFIRYAANSPVRITGARFTSENISDGSPNSANYDGTITTSFVSPFQTPKTDYFNMRALRSSQDFAKEYAEIDFKAAGVSVMVSPETFTTMVIQPGSRLTVVLYVGAQASTAQRMYRDLKAADQELSNAGLM